MSRMNLDQPKPSSRPAQEPTSQERSVTSFASASPAKAPFSLLPWVLAGAVVFLLAVVFAFTGRSKSATPDNMRRQDDYAGSLSFYDLQMSESTSLSGGKSTYIDGQVKNTGSQTVSAITVQVAFANDEALPPQVITLPLAVIRTREPYVDTEPLSAAPLGPGMTREFRLIFEGVGANWNQQLPLIHIAQVFTQCKPCR